MAKTRAELEDEVARLEKVHAALLEELEDVKADLEEWRGRSICQDDRYQGDE